jgi:hypothetical protein
MDRKMSEKEISRFMKLAGLIRESSDYDTLQGNAYADKLNRDAYFAKQKEKQNLINKFDNLEQAKEVAKRLSIKDPKAFYIIEKNKDNQTFFIIKQQRRHVGFPGVATYRGGLAK